MSSLFNSLPQQSSLLPEELTDVVALAADAAQRGKDGQFDELRGRLTQAGAPAGELSPLWQRFFETTGLSGWQAMNQRAERIQRQVQEDGATYNVYSDDDELQSSRVWPLELLPMLIGADEWRGIEQGVVQRARLLNETLADVYGPRRLLDAGLLPPSLVFAHPQYLRPMHGCVPPGGIYLHSVAFDLARGADGLWWVVGQRTQAPSGPGYMLENRLIIAQQFPEAFREMSVQRLAASFQAMMQGLMRLSPGGERSRVALLTPGPRNETYFEHAFLARYLGVTLVEGGDLTVRGNRVYLKTLHGLERVHVLLRRVDDDYLDPLELRSDSALGVPGLLQALRAGEVVVANAPGAGWLESPGLSAFWPGVARHLLGEELLLPASEAWWCGEDTVWQEHRDQLDEYVVAPTFSGSDTTQSFSPAVIGTMTAGAREALLSRIAADPAAHTLQARVRPSETPVWHDGTLEPRAAVLRVFAVADGAGSWRVMPGGLTRVASRQDQMHKGSIDPWLSMRHGSASVDSWVLTEGQVDTTSLLPKPLTPADLTGSHWTVTSRSAENLFWLGRYTERAENSVRLARLSLETLAASTRNGSSSGVLKLIDELARRHGLVGESVPSAAAAPRVFERSLMHALSDAKDSNSVAWNLRALQPCAQALRERLSAEHWKLIHEVGDHFSQHMKAVLEAKPAEPRADVMGVLARAATHLAAITGAQTDRMTRDDGWRLLSVGRQVERLDFLAHALAVGFELGLHHSDDGFALLLGLFDSTMTYRAKFQARREVPPLLHLLVYDTDNPRSLAWVARTMRQRMLKLSRSESAWALEVTATLPRLEKWPLERACTPAANGEFVELIAMLHECSEQALALSVAIGRRLFSHVGTVDRVVWQ